MALMLFLATLLSVVLVSDCTFRPFDCSNLYNSGETDSGIYSIYPAGDNPVWVYCHMINRGWTVIQRRMDGNMNFYDPLNEGDNGGWTVIQRRMDGSVNFYQPWNKYKRGFGNVQSEYWMGLENMYQLTRNRNYTLRVDLEDFTGRKGFAQYSTFRVGPETDGYRLQVSGFTDGGAGDSLSGHNGMKFSTFDKDQDTYGTNCAKQYLGAFWYAACPSTNPNGVYLWGEDPTHMGIGNVWYTWKNSHAVGMKSIIMKIRRVS
ncbi:microfibril-associated glycoprotein 4-like [Pseudorasbora parva]|uniref:microfibril-associated glycoprotein 4-like n=1 Tax=Pseudorasbora parva TaxID=51549 RepID=UPI00351EEB36